MTAEIPQLAARLYGTHIAINNLGGKGRAPAHLIADFQMLWGKIQALGAKVEEAADALGAARPRVVGVDGVSVPYDEGKLWAEKLVQAEMDAAARRR